MALSAVASGVDLFGAGHSPCAHLWLALLVIGLHLQWIN